MRTVDFMMLILFLICVAIGIGYYLGIIEGAEHFKASLEAVKEYVNNSCLCVK